MLNFLLFIVFGGFLYLFVRLAYLWWKLEVEIRAEEKINQMYREKREKETQSK